MVWLTMVVYDVQTQGFCQLQSHQMHASCVLRQTSPSVSFAPQYFMLLVTLLQTNQSVEMLQHIFAFIRCFIHKVSSMYCICSYALMYCNVLYCVLYCIKSSTKSYTNTLCTVLYKFSTNICTMISSAHTYVYTYICTVL